LGFLVWKYTICFVDGNLSEKFSAKVEMNEIDTWAGRGRWTGA
jgi:hypothetical protein